MRQQFVFVGPTHQVVAQHLVRTFGRLAAGPEVDQQTSDDRAVGLDLDPVRVIAQQVPAAQQVLERAEEDLSVPIIVPPKMTLLSSWHDCRYMLSE